MVRKLCALFRVSKDFIQGVDQGWSPITGLGSPFRPTWLLVELVSFQLQGHENLLPQGQEEREAPTSSQGLTCLPQSYPRCLLFY